MHLPKMGKILSLSHARCVGHNMMEKKRKKRNTRSDVIFIFSLFVCPAVAIKFGGKMPFVLQ